MTITLEDRLRALPPDRRATVEARTAQLIAEEQTRRASEGAGQEDCIPHSAPWEPRVAQIRYDRAAGRMAVDLTNGGTFSFLPRSLQEPSIVTTTRPLTSTSSEAARPRSSWAASTDAEASVRRRLQAKRCPSRDGGRDRQQGRPAPEREGHPWLI